jgi:hypothetical protein
VASIGIFYDIKEMRVIVLEQVVKMRFSVILLVFVVLQVSTAQSQGVVINELINSSSTGEWIELVVLQDSLDMRGYSLRDFSSGGSAQNPLVFSAASLWSAVPIGTVIVIGDAGFAGSTDVDPSDHTLTVKSSDALYFSGTVFSFAATSDAIQIRNAAGTHLVGVSWGSANATSLGSPKAHFTGSLSSGTVIAFTGGGTADLTNTTNWQFAGPTATPGAGNSPANTAWITLLRANADGSGSAAVKPDTLQHGTTTDLQVRYKRDTAYTITDLRVLLPAAFTWSHSASDVSLANVTATVTVSGDTVLLAGASLTADSCMISVRNVISPDSSAFYPIRVQSKSVSQFRSVAPLPTVVAFGLPGSVASAKGNDNLGIALRSGQLVTVRGIVTVANEFGGPSYLQDNTGGIAVFGSNFSSAVAIGDEVVVSGVVQPYSGLTELVNPFLHSIVTGGNAVEPAVVSASQIRNDGAGGVETYEGRLIRINGMTVTGTGTWTANTNYSIFDGNDTTQIRIDNNTNLVGAAIPASVCDVIGVVGQFITTSPFIGGYQIMPRSSADLVSSGPMIATMPAESNITPTSMKISWTTTRRGTSGVFYGMTKEYELGAVSPDTTTGTAHEVQLVGLVPATVYHVQAFSASGTDTSRASDLIVSSASPATASGSINVYFNKSVRPSTAPPPAAAGDQNLVALLTTRFNNAHRSIDAAFYSLSGTPGPGTDLANALIAAKGRGVSIRVICEQDNRSTSPLNALASAGIPIITDSFDPVNAGAGLMHNKYVVIDGRGGAPESTWVWTGSWNPTDPGTNDDYQNALEIQDPALAGAYELEFNEMWGSATQTPVASLSRFGARKTDNTPHRFRIGGRDIELFFSPSDKTSSHIAAALDGATHSINFALLTFTRDDLAKVIIGRKSAGVTLHGLMDNRTDSGSEYDYLAGQGVDMHLKTGTGLLHHKYAILDAGFPTAHPTVITGSHNWSSSAETANNENTLIIHDAAIANLYLQEFAARYYQFGGTDSIATGVDGDVPVRPEAFALMQNYPNPFNPTTKIGYRVPGLGSRVKLSVFDLLGREVAVLVNETKAPGDYEVRFDASGLASGVYLARLQAGGVNLVRSMILLR